MTRKVKQSTYKRKCDALFSALVRGRAGRCERCLLTPNEVRLNCAHWLSRRFAHTRTDFRNAVSLCVKCHRAFGDDPTGFSDWMIGRNGRGTYRLLRMAANRRNKFDWAAEHERLLEEPMLPTDSGTYSEAPRVRISPKVSA